MLEQPVELLHNLQALMLDPTIGPLVWTGTAILVLVGTACKLAINSFAVARKAGGRVLAMFRRKPKPVEPLDPLTASLFALLDGTTRLLEGKVIEAAKTRFYPDGNGSSYTINTTGESGDLWKLIPLIRREMLKKRLDETHAKLTEEEAIVAREAAAAKVSGAVSVGAMMVQCCSCGAVIPLNTSHKCEVRTSPPKANTGRVPVLDNKPLDTTTTGRHAAIKRWLGYLTQGRTGWTWTSGNNMIAILQTPKMNISIDYGNGLAACKMGQPISFGVGQFSEETWSFIANNILAAHTA